jgi:hypothetical protein
VVLDIGFRDEEGGNWIEGGGWLDALIPLRDDILWGDYRALYLAWLKTLEMDYVLDSVAEPPVPPGLQDLTPALQRFVVFFEIDKVLIQVAAEASGERDRASDDWMRRVIPGLSREECDTFLIRLVQGEAHLGLALKKRLRGLSGAVRNTHMAQEPRRSVGQLLSEAERRRKRERKRRAEAAERRRIERLAALSKREAQVWEKVEALIQRSQAKPYDEATQLLSQLKELAVYQGREADFEAQMAEICQRYKRRPALMGRFHRAKLMER